uniref:Integrase catalytic domain-containing protein n=1 Tax=Vitis vinifera TaxID=29760 RepID=A5BL05_VITVI|nr:hypothetical protein VITISV_004160 [Vitis vinifera]
MGTLSTHVMIGPVSYSILFQALRIQSSFNLLLGHPWIHEAGVIPSSLHQKVKFIHKGHIITIQSNIDIITSSELVLHISHSEDDLHLTGFTFDEVQVVSLEDGSTDMGSHEFTFAVNHDTPYGLGYIPIEDDTRYMAWLCRDIVRARMSSIPFDYPLRPYTFQLANYFIRGSKHTPQTEGTVHILETIEIQDIQQALGQMHLDTRTTEAPGAMIVSPPSPDRASVFSMCFPKEVHDYDLPMDLGDGTDEMDMVNIGNIFDVAPRRPHTVFDMFGVFVLETDGDDSIPDAYTNYMDFIGIGFEGTSDSMDPHLSFDTMSGFFTRFDDIYDGNNDMSIFEYLLVSQHFPLIAPPSPTTHIYDVDDVGDTDDPLGDVEVYVDDMIVKSQDMADHLATLQRFFERIRQLRLRLNPKKCTFGVTSRKLIGHIVSEQGIEVDAEKIKAILDMPALRTKKEIRGFLGRLQYISHFIARLTDICEPIFCLLRKNQLTVWSDDCQRAFERIKKCLLSPPILVPPTSGRLLLLYLSVSDMASRCMLTQLDDLGKEQALYYLSKRMLEYECRYIMIERLCLALVWATRRLKHYMAEYSVLLVSRLDPLRYLFDRPVLTGRLMRWMGDHIPRSVRLAFFDHQRLMNNIVEYEACIIGLVTALDLSIRQLEIHGDSNLVIQQTQGIWMTQDEKLKPYHAYLDLLIDRFDVLRYIHLPRAEKQFANALATLASVIVIPTGVTVRPLLIKTRSAPAYHCLIGEIEDQIELPWRLPDGLLLLCLDRASADRVMREVHVGVYGPHMRGHMLALWGIDIIGKISPKSYSGHEYILVAIDYFTKWVEAAPYARLTMAKVTKFIRSHIIYRYGIPHELIYDRGVHFRGEVDSLIQEYGNQHRISSTYGPQTNGTVEDANKNIKRILRKMVETFWDWSEKLPFAL